MLSGIAVALPLTAVSSQFVIGSFEARFFARVILAPFCPAEVRVRPATGIQTRSLRTAQTAA